VAILDLDIHHGNGTQDIFYASAEVLYCSLHGEPEWAYPPHTGFAGEAGTGAGEGYTFNQPLPQGTDWKRYAGALDAALERIARFDPAYVVLSQGFDTFEGDRWGGFVLGVEDYRRIGERVVALGRPALAVLEGGYEPEKIAAGSLALLDGLDGFDSL
jgi:acetoin utilization deacetylase AcuC-like enzyme